jgi:beta-carotene 15,15'-dioxygenase
MNWLRYAISLVSVLIYLLIASYSTVLALDFIYFIIIVGLLTIGIPHGAVDHLLQKGKTRSLFKFIFYYLLLIIFYFIVWQYFPLCSLVFFILYSSFHIGESELETIGIQVLSIRSHLDAFLLGLAILFFIIFSHFNESISVISTIRGLQFVKSFDGEFVIYRLLIASVALTYILYQTLRTKKSSYIATLLLLLLGTQVPLIFAFALYFICQHSYNAWGHIKFRLSIDSISLYKKALPYTLGSLLIFMAFLYGSVEILNFKNLLAHFFIFLACISLPHFLLMHLFYKA